MDIIAGFGTLFSSTESLLFVVLGSVLGLLVGAIPGLTAAAAIAMLMPVTFYLEPLSALAFIYTLSKTASFGGSIPAILFNTPGTAAAAATQIEGYPLTRQGKQGKALKIAVIASAIGDTFSELLLIFGAVYIAIYTARIGAPEYFAVYGCAFIIVGSVIGASVVKGLISTLFGILVATVGLDPITALPRYDFGILELSSGLNLIPVLLGIFVISEVLVQAEQRVFGQMTAVAPRSPDPADSRVSWPELRRCLPTIARSTSFGVVIGMLPGVGAAVACFVGYAEAKRASKTPEIWGKGAIEGVAASEAANNSVSGANLIPLLTLGVPGSTAAAMLMGVFMIHGIHIGPQVFITSRDLIYGLFAAGLVSIALYTLIGYFGSNLIGRMVSFVPIQIIYPIIFVTAFISAYAVNSSLFDVLVASVFGIIGYLMRRFDFSLPAFIIAFILGGGAEVALRRTLLMSDAGILILLERPIALIFLAIGLAVVILRLSRPLRIGNGGRASVS